MSFAEDAFTNGNIFLGHREERVAIRTLERHSFFPAVLRTAVPGPPVLRVALSVECAFAGDGDVSLVERVDKRRVVENLHAFPAREHNRQEVFWVSAELDRRAFRDNEIDVALEMNRTRQERAFGNDNSPAACFRARIDGLAKCTGAIGFTVAPRAKTIHIKSADRELRWFDAFAYRRHHRLPRVGLC